MTAPDLTEIARLARRTHDAHTTLGAAIADLLTAIDTASTDNPITTAVATAPPGLRRLLNALLGAGGTATYAQLLADLDVSPAALGAMRSRTPLGPQLITEHQDNTGGWRYTLNPTQLDNIRQGLTPTTT